MATAPALEPVIEPIDPPAGDPPAAPAANDPPAAPPANDPPAGDPPAGNPPASDWRSEWAAGDDKLLGWLGRYQSPKAAMAAVKKHGDDIASGKYVKPLGEDATDEEVAAYRKQNGVPDKPDDYLENLSDGFVIGDDDKSLVGRYLPIMQNMNIPKSAAEALIKEFKADADDTAAAKIEANEQAKSAAEEALRQEWVNPGEYKRNINILNNYFGGLPQDVNEAVIGATDANGVQLLNNPAVVKFFMDQALKDNPIATVVPGAGANQASAIADEIETLEKKMENRREWFKDEASQARYQELITARDKLNERGG